MLNKRILVIGDLHFPYHHSDTFDFLSLIKKKYKPDRIISIGDEIDGHAWSYHEQETELDGPGIEFNKAKKCMKKLEKLFPRMDILESNHGSLHNRKSQTHGIPKGFIKSYNQAWGVSNKWKWHWDMNIKLPNKQMLYLHHARSKNIIKSSQMLGKNCIFGHHHNEQYIRYWTGGYESMFGAFTGCLVDIDSLAQEYGRINIHKPLLGSIIVENSKPRILRMNVNNKNRWDGDV